MNRRAWFDQVLTKLIRWVAGFGFLVGVVVLAFHLYTGVSGMPYIIEILFLITMVLFWKYADRI
jgi:hypothetical protein